VKSQDLEIFFSNFCVFLGKTTPYDKIFNLKVFTSSPIDVVVFNFRKIFRREIGEIVRCLSKINNFRLPLKLPLLRGYVKNLPGPAPTIWLTLFQISYKSVHFGRSYRNRMREGRSFGPFFWPIKYLRYSHRIYSRRIIKGYATSTL